MFVSERFISRLSDENAMMVKAFPAVTTLVETGYEVPKEVFDKLTAKPTPPVTLPEPSIADMAGNFKAALADWATAGFPITTREFALARAEICKSCEFWNAKARLGLGKCTHPKCGCTRLKWWLATSSCPAGKWPGLTPT
jgi:hypothetical protein